MKHGKGESNKLKELIDAGFITPDITEENVLFIVENITNKEYFRNTSHVKGSSSYRRNTKHFCQIVARDLLKFYHKENQAKGLNAGYVYLVSNPAWDSFKVGSAIDVIDRLNSYQTYSPARDYTLEFYFFSFDRRRDEKLVLGSFEHSNEWISAPKELIIRKMKELAVYR